ncbi:DEAD/DEAH box helicase [Pectobacteriaceae bacterium CE70]|nr:DEAD/DEAH box helicase [Pectobacteriaceae bacterium CE70]WJY09466.1 DEAD/DEAH box helicase [Pectobacteriaceae bacterium C80]
MSNFYIKLSERILASNDFKNCSLELFKCYANYLVGDVYKLDRLLVKKMATASQIFYKTQEEKYLKQGSSILSMLIDTCAEVYPEIVPISDFLFSSVGDFPNVKLLEKRFPQISFRHNIFTDSSQSYKKALNNVEELGLVLTDFQRNLWDDLQAGEDVITVAPTSAGKTHIILHYLLSEVINSDGAFAAIVVPTRALITEVSSKIFEMAKERGYEKNIEICTIPKDEVFSERTFFVMTQERLHEILLRGDIYFDFLFIDEAHNISDEGRGVLLHLTLERILEDSSPQIIIGMPSAQYQNSFSSIFKDVEFTKAITTHSPVSKLIFEVRAKGVNLEITKRGSDDKITLPKKFTNKKLADVVLRLGKNQSNIIYRNQTNHCEHIADEIAKRIIDYEVNDTLNEASEYIQHFIHDDFTLVENIKKGVAFHYSPLPTSVRILIENLVKEGHIKFISCTSTLAEGVNLPAKNLFMLNPTLKNGLYNKVVRIEDVKINNITGRAGRMLQHFSGNIFLVEPDDWTFKDYFDEDDNKKEEKIPTYYKLINENINEVLRTLTGFQPDDEDHSKFYSVANKLIKSYGNGDLDSTFSSPDIKIDNFTINRLKQVIETAYLNLKVPPLILESNPTTGYIQQNKVFEFLTSEIDLNDWSLPYPRSEEFYDRLLKISFKLIELGVFIPSGNYTADYICYISKKWVQNNSLKDMINSQIDWDKNNIVKTNSRDNEKEVKINRSVKNIINVINNDIRFRLSNAVKCYFTLFTLAARMKKSDAQSVKLHYYLEIGASDERMMSLINLGLSREASKEISDNTSKSRMYNSISDLIQLLNSSEINNVHKVIKKEIEHLLSRS